MYDDLVPGREFLPFEFPVTREFVNKFAETVEDPDPLYHDETYARQQGYARAIAPPSIAGIYCRLAYLGKDYLMPPGGVMAKLEFEFFNPPEVGDTLIARARVIERYERKERKYVVIEVNTVSQAKTPVSTVRLTAIWPR